MIDVNKTYHTREGREVRIYATDGRGLRPVHGAIKVDDGFVPAVWDSEGLYFNRANVSEHDLIEVKPRTQHTRWLNVYPERVSGPFETKEQADCVADSNRIACVKIEIDCEHGEGL